MTQQSELFQPGTLHPSKGTWHPGKASGAGTCDPIPGTVKPRRLAYDYDTRNGGTLVDGAGGVWHPGTFTGAVIQAALLGAWELITEATTGSYDLVERNDALDLASVRGVKVLMIATRQTKNYRLDHGIEKSNLNDALAILAVSNMPRAHLTPMKHKEIPDALGILARLVNMRRSGYKNVDGLWAKKTLKGTGHKKPWHLQHALVALSVVERGGGRAQYEFKVGTYGTGRPCMPRASIMRDGITRAAKKDPAARKAELKRMRHESRHIFALVRDGHMRSLNGHTRTLSA